jgi:hypothetical protein
MNIFCKTENRLYICSAFLRRDRKKRELSSAGSKHPDLNREGRWLKQKRELSSAGSEHLPYKQGVTGSNPVVPTS